MYNTELKVVEVAHDYQAQVQKYVVDELKLLNSYDTWHGKTAIHCTAVTETFTIRHQVLKMWQKGWQRLLRVQFVLKESLGSANFQTNVSY